jgi:hypothetical protein
VTKSSKIVDLKSVRNPEKVAAYVARYSASPVKLIDHPFERRVEIFESFHGRRLAGTWGAAKDVSLSPPRTIEVKRFTRLGSWDIVHLASRTDPIALEILRAWSEGVPIEDGLTCIDYENQIDNMPFSSELDTMTIYETQAAFW